MKYIKYLILVFSAAIFVSTYFYEKVRESAKSDYVCIAEESAAMLESLDQKSKQYLNKFAENILFDNPDNDFNYQKLLIEKPYEWLSIFVYKNDSLEWWSDNTIQPDRNILKPGIQFYKNGWYKYYEVKKDETIIVGLLKIKSQYSFQNKFLENNFHDCFKIPSNTNITITNEAGSVPVTNSSGETYFYLNFSDNAISERGDNLIIFIYLICYIIFLVSFYYVARSLFVRRISAGALTLLVIIITRTLSVYLNFPYSLYELALFSPSYYASSFLLKSLGDLLITSFILVYIIQVVYRNSGIKSDNRLQKFSARSRQFLIGIVIVFTLVYSSFINHLLSGLIINSNISFNINNVFDLDFYSLIGVLIIGILLISLYIVCDGAARFIHKSNISSKPLTTVIVIAVVFFVLHVYLFKGLFLFADYGTMPFLITVFLIFYSGIIRQRLKHLNAFTRTLLIIFGFSLYAAQTISTYNKQKEQENRKLIASKLENEQDQIAEYLFDDLVSDISNDTTISSYFTNPYEQLLSSVASKGIIEKRLLQQYFTGYWGKYDIIIKCFNKDGLPINTGGDPSWNIDHFNRIIREEGMDTQSPMLYFTGNNSGKLSYIGRIPVYHIHDSDTKTGTIVIALESKPLQGEAGFPELLISDKIPKKRDISNYSYAHYRNGMLVNQFGDYNYLVSSGSYSRYITTTETQTFEILNGYSHLFYSSGNDGLLIVSIQNPGILEFITLFSYLFSFYAIVFIIIYVILLLLKSGGSISINFKNRIQATVMMIVVITMLLIGGATVYYIFRNYSTNLGLIVNDRLKSMLIAIQEELSTRTLEEKMVNDEMNYSFSKLASTLAIDLNIFSENGKLIYSTQPKIYDQQLIARTMNRDALYNFKVNNKSLYIQYEKIGNLNFLSAYEPVRNNNYQTVGYINLPYFARQDELKKDISAFLVALINIYVLLFAFSIFITFIISSRITKPLQLIQQRLGKIKLGTSNELIEWDHDDEIGGLVKEYNRMVDELAESADLLARSERESAWREMAKQVAHEIKNPLTPMKLSVQHLQRAWKEQNPNVDQIMQRFSQTLIEQIDTLSNIATEFSNFAKMPRTNNEELNVAAILKNIVALYSENQKATITYYEHPKGIFVALADKEQMIRVFSNLLKNALQAVEETTEGHIHVEIKQLDRNIIISVKDNGSGIPDTEKSKIFTPNFTTKTGGMGLGLAMVKNIVEQASGNVWFTSNKAEGTIFFVSLPSIEALPIEDNS